jgi:hypothetical protein
MLTDEEVGALVSTWHGRAGLTITADDITRRARHRRRRGVIRGIAILVLVAAVAVAGTLIGQNAASRRVPSVSPSPSTGPDWYPPVPADLQALNQKCYADIASGTVIGEVGRTHRYAGPPQPAVIVRHSTESLLVYYSFAAGSGLYSCSSGTQKGGLLSASPSHEYGVQFEQATSLEEANDGWVIGFVPADTVSGTVAAPGTPTGPISVNHGLFAAFSSGFGREITVVAHTPTMTYTYPYRVTPPPPVPVPTDSAALAAACYRRVPGGPGGYHGPRAPALELQQGSRRELVFYNFVPKSMIYLCSDGFSSTGVGNFAPDAYGIHLSDQNCVTGFVPADTVSGTITYHGDTEPISVNHGLFAASISHFDIADYTVIIVAETPTKIYTIAGAKVTVKDR